MIDQPVTLPSPEPTPVNPPVGFCQHCGKPLNSETIRKVGSGVFCEPCLADRLAGATTGPNPAATPKPDNSHGWSSVHGGATFNGASANGAGTKGTSSSASSNFWNPPSGFSSSTTGGNPAGTGPNPNLAFLLGLIPGVGAMYNEQYDKGLVHLAIFAFLVILSHASGIFGLFIAGWIFYMAIEAHHTARARRDGLPLPNPFGFNDIGERFGFGRNWSQPSGSYRSGTSNGFGSPVPPAAGTQTPPAWGAPADGFPADYQAPPASYGQTPPQAPYAQTPYTQTTYTGPTAAYPPYTPTGPGMNAGFVPTVGPAPAPRPMRFPVGAIWLIGLGVLFLLSTTGLSRVFSGTLVIGFGLAGLGAWNFSRRFLDYAPAAGVFESHDDMLLRVTRALRSSIWLILVGLLMILNGAHLLSWGHSWPLFLIAAGVLKLMERSFYSSRFTAQPGPRNAGARNTAPPVTPPQPAPRPTYGDWNPPPADPYSAESAGQPHEGGR